MKIINKCINRLEYYIDMLHTKASINEIKRLKCNDFTIISNNCWAGWVYRYFDLPYLSPTVGMFILSDDYIKLCAHIQKYFTEELIFIDPEHANRYSQVKNYVEKFGQYPIGRLGDVDIHFLHSRSKEEAFEKWNRRLERVNYNKLIVKSSVQNLWKDEYAYAFDKLSLENKLLFTPKKYNLNSTTEVVFKRDRYLKETRDEGKKYYKYIDILEYINSCFDETSYEESGIKRRFLK